MPGAIKMMKRAKSIFDEAGHPKAREALRRMRECSRFVLNIALVGAILAFQPSNMGANAVGLSLNIAMTAHMKVEVSSGVSDPALAAISRTAAQQRYSANAAPSLWA